MTPDTRTTENREPRYEDVAPEGRRISDVGGESSLVQTLSAAMAAKLAKNRGKRHWQDAAPAYLIDRLRQEVEELEQAIGGYLEEGSADEDDVWAEAADVANFAAMLADNATGRAEAAQGAAPRAEGLDALASILRKLIRQYHGVAHGGGSWLFCDDRWCADMREVLGEER